MHLMSVIHAGINPYGAQPELGERHGFLYDYLNGRAQTGDCSSAASGRQIWRAIFTTKNRLGHDEETELCAY